MSRNASGARAVAGRARRMLLRLIAAIPLALALAVCAPASPARAAETAGVTAAPSGPRGDGPSLAAASLGDDDFSNAKISEKDPSFSLSFAFIGYSALKILWVLCSSLADVILSLAEWFLKLAGSSVGSISQQDFGTGTFAGFYQAAKTVSSYAIQPYAFAGLAVVFAVWLIRSSDPRRKQTGDDWFAEFLMIIAMFAVCATLIAHAVDLCGGLYWLGQNLVRGIDQALATIGLQPGMGDVQLRSEFMDEMNAVTYGQAGPMVVLLLLSLVALVACATCCCTVLGTLFTRVAKIYLEATVSPIALSLLVEERTRPIGVAYIRGFLALCFQAALIFLTLAFAPLLFSVAAAAVGPLVDGQPGIDGLGGAMAALLPAMAAIFSITSLVKASEPISRRLFGVAA